VLIEDANTILTREFTSDSVDLSSVGVIPTANLTVRADLLSGHADSGCRALS
jgi:hypothetical protein